MGAGSKVFLGEPVLRCFLGVPSEAADRKDSFVIVDEADLLSAVCHDSVSHLSPL